MVLETFKTLVADSYVAVPPILQKNGYSVCNRSFLTQWENDTWRMVLSIRQVRRKKPKTVKDYLNALWSLGIRSVAADSPDIALFRKKYKPIKRRII